jgi:hypothetical protein
MLRYVQARCSALHGVDANLFFTITYMRVMSFLRIKTITKNGKTYKYIVRQTNVRKGKKVYSIMEHICGFGMSMLSPGGSGSFSGHRPTDKRQIRDQEQADRELFVKNRAMFNAKVRKDYEHEHILPNNSKRFGSAKSMVCSEADAINNAANASPRATAMFLSVAFICYSRV